MTAVVKARKNHSWRSRMPSRNPGTAGWGTRRPVAPPVTESYFSSTEGKAIINERVATAKYGPVRRSDGTPTAMPATAATSPDMIIAVQKGHWAPSKNPSWFWVSVSTAVV
jgi:hypothetical protein